MDNNFDVTTSGGLKKAAEFFKEGSLLAWVANPFATLFFAGERLIKANSESTSVESQGKAAVDIIRQGKESGARKIKVTIDQQAGANLDIPVEGARVSAMMGSKGKMTLEVEYD